MSKFKPGDRVVVVKDDIAYGYWMGTRGEVANPDTGNILSVRVETGDGNRPCFKEEELEFENVYDALSKPSDADVVQAHDLIAESLGLKVDKSDSVNHPSHYTSHPSGVECIQVTEHMNFNLGNATKYIWRAGLKSDDPIQDLQKALWYVEREIQRLGGTVGR
jgi:hypothetical protein